MNESFGVRAKRMLVRLVVVLAVVVLGGAAVVLLSQLNARTYSLREESGTLAVMKGRNLPVGAVPWRPGDAALADAYAPIPLEGQDVTELAQRRFSDRDELDRALFALLERLAGQRITSGLVVPIVDLADLLSVDRRIEPGLSRDLHPAIVQPPPGDPVNVQ